MKILLVNNTKIPALLYGGTERAIWWLGKELTRRGHKVVYLVAPESSCPFAEVKTLNPEKPLNDQIPGDVDVVHLHFQIKEELQKPYLITFHGNYHPEKFFNINTVFVSRNHAQRNSSETFVHNSLDPDDYGPVDLSLSKKYLLFLAWPSRPEKNLKASLKIARKTKNVLAVLGGKDKWFKRRPWVEYKGFISNEEKNAIVRNSKALVFPVRWYEPCALSIIESFYFGCPVFGTTYGCLPELVTPDKGFLSNSCRELINAVKLWDQFDRKKIHEYACDYFSIKRMTQQYLALYEKVMNKETLNLRPPVNGGNFSRENLLPFEY